MPLHINAPGATPEQIQKALAEAVFAAAGVTPMEAAFPADEKPRNALLTAACVLDEAREAAMRACYGMTTRPWEAGMNVRPNLPNAR